MAAKTKAPIVARAEPGFPGQQRFRRLQLVLVEVQGVAPDTQTFDEMCGRVTPELWTPVEFYTSDHPTIQVACTDGQWHPVRYGLFGDVVDTTRGGGVVDGCAVFAAGEYAEGVMDLLAPIPTQEEPR